MLLWIAFTLMTAAAILAVLWPLSRSVGAARDASVSAEADLAVYRDQLGEIERDRDSGLIGAAESEAARVEVARRILRASAEIESSHAVAGGADFRRRAVALIALIGVPLIAGTLYVALGSPQSPGQPLASRLEAQPEQTDIAMLMKRVEDHLNANPSDGRGFEVIAPIYLRVGRADDAARAWENALRLLGPSAARQNGLGEALIAAAGGVVTTEAADAFRAALAQDPKDFKARYFLGLAAEQDGKPEDAAAQWKAIEADSPPDAPWLPVIRTALARVGEPAASAAPGPDAAAVAAAADLSDEQRNEMVRGMVDRLSSRLTTDGGTIDEWLHLIRAWNVLGDRGKAIAAADDARRRFSTDDAARARIDALVRDLGLQS